VRSHPSPGGEKKSQALQEAKVDPRGRNGSVGGKKPNRPPVEVKFGQLGHRPRLLSRGWVGIRGADMGSKAAVAPAGGYIQDEILRWEGCRRKQKVAVVTAPTADRSRGRRSGCAGPRGASSCLDLVVARTERSSRPAVAEVGHNSPWFVKGDSRRRTLADLDPASRGLGE